MKNFASWAATIVAAASFGGFTAGAGENGFSGKVVETMNSGNYTYVLVDTGTNQVWAAANQFQVKKGDTVAVPETMPMTDFHSKTLNRDFKVIYFASQVRVNGASPDAVRLPEGHPPIGGAAPALPEGHPPMTAKPPAPKLDFAGVKPPSGGKTVAEIYASSAKLEGKSVKLRGKVVKYNANIMGKNWLHVQDGTGSAGSNDLLITCATPAKVGDTVLVEGKLGLNKDFGAGYKYNVLVEDAKVTVE